MAPISMTLSDLYSVNSGLTEWIKAILQLWKAIYQMVPFAMTLNEP